MKKITSITQKFLIFVSFFLILAAAGSWLYINNIKELEKYTYVTNVLSSVKGDIVALEYAFDIFIITGDFEKGGTEAVKEKAKVIDREIEQLESLPLTAIFRDNPALAGEYNTFVNEWKLVKEKIMGMGGVISKEEGFLIHNDVDLKTFIITEKVGRLSSFIYDEKARAFSTLNNQIIYGFILFIFLILIAAYIFYSRTLGRIKIIAADAEKMMNTDSGAGIKTTSTDEIDVLANTLNGMADTINMAHAALEKDVLDRTRELEIRARELATVNKVTGLIGRTLAEEEIAGIVLDELMLATKADAGWVYLAGGDTEAKLRLNAPRGVSHTFIREAKEAKIEDGGIIGRQIKGKGCIFINVSEIDNRFRPLLEEMGIKRLCILPIIYADTMIGIINLAGKRLDCFSDNESKSYIFAGFLANEIAVAINHTKLFQKEFKSRQFMERIIHQSPVGIAVFDKNGVCVMLNSAYKKLFGLTSDEQVIGKYNLFKDNELEEKGYAQAIKKTFEGESIDMEIEYDVSKVWHTQDKGGSKGLRVKIFPIFDNDGSVSNIAAIYEGTERNPWS